MSEGHPNKQYRDILIDQSIDHLQRDGWFEPTEPFILSTKTAEQGIEALHEAKQLLLQAIHQYNVSESEAGSLLRRYSKLIVTLDAVTEALRPITHGEDPTSLMFGSFGHKDPRTHGKFHEGVNEQIVAAVDCIKRHCPEIKNPSAHIARLLKRLGVEKKSERTVRNLWNNRESEYAYDKTGFESLFLVRLTRTPNYEMNRITQKAIETAFKDSINIFQDSNRPRKCQG